MRARVPGGRGAARRPGRPADPGAAGRRPLQAARGRRDDRLDPGPRRPGRRPPRRRARHPDARRRPEVPRGPGAAPAPSTWASWCSAPSPGRDRRRASTRSSASPARCAPPAWTPRPDGCRRRSRRSPCSTPPPRPTSTGPAGLSLCAAHDDARALRPGLRGVLPGRGTAPAAAGRRPTADQLRCDRRWPTRSPRTAPRTTPACRWRCRTPRRPSSSPPPGLRRHGRRRAGHGRSPPRRAWPCPASCGGRDATGPAAADRSTAGASCATCCARAANRAGSTGARTGDRPRRIVLARRRQRVDVRLRRRRCSASPTRPSARDGAPVEVFTLGTRLTRVTAELGHRDPDAAMAAVGRAVAGRAAAPGWARCSRSCSTTGASGGPRAARSWWCCPTAGSAATRRCSASRWAACPPRAPGRVGQPAQGRHGFEPPAAGLAAALPHVDDFVSGHSIAALEDLADVVRGRRRERPGTNAGVAGVGTYRAPGVDPR